MNLEAATDTGQRLVTGGFRKPQEALKRPGNGWTRPLGGPQRLPDCPTEAWRSPNRSLMEDAYGA